MSAQNKWSQNRLLTANRITLGLSAKNIRLGVETTIAHSNNDTVKPCAWTPILFGPFGLAHLAEET